MSLQISSSLSQKFQPTGILFAKLSELILGYKSCVCVSRGGLFFMILPTPGERGVSLYIQHLSTPNSRIITHLKAERKGVCCGAAHHRGAATCHAAAAAAAGTHITRGDTAHRGLRLNLAHLQHFALTSIFFRLFILCSPLSISGSKIAYFVPSVFSDLTSILRCHLLKAVSNSLSKRERPPSISKRLIIT